VTHPLANFAAFQACWFANVLGAAHGLPWAGPLVTAGWLAVHLAGLRGEAAVELRVLVAAALLGWLADSGLVLAGLVTFPETTRLGGPSPVWMVALWAAFAATLRHSLGWLRGRLASGALLGAAGGPLAYLAGQSLGAITLTGEAGIAAVAVQYALATPLLLALVVRAERGAEPAPDPQPEEARS
jgi:hypothetical protein